MAGLPNASEHGMNCVFQNDLHLTHLQPLCCEGVDLQACVFSASRWVGWGGK
jgi:hypothetical protein